MSSESDAIVRDLAALKDAKPYMEILKVIAGGEDRGWRGGGSMRSDTAAEILAALQEYDRVFGLTRDSKEHTGTPEYVRQLEDAALLLWAELPHDVTVELQHECPTLMNFMVHLHHFIEHEQAITRVNVWAP